jgi:hypothetical protein
MSQETIERTFKVEDPAKLKVSNVRGQIDIQPGEDGVIVVTAVKHLSSGSNSHTEIKIEQTEDGQVVVKTEYANSVADWFGLNKPCKVDYSVRVPKNCTVRASGVSSEISICDLDGAFDISSVSGSVKLSDLSGPMKAGTVSGSIKAEKIIGALDANSVSGSIRVLESQIPDALVKTVSGRIVLQTPLADGPYIFKGVSGDVILVVPQDTGCVAHHKSVSGRLKTSLPITKDQRYGSRGLAEIQGGGPEVTYKSVSGSFRIVTSEDEKIVEQHATSNRPHQAKNQLEILQKIESGELSVEDALNQLNA